VILEALSLGISVISTDNPGCRYVLDNGRFGPLVPQEDPEKLAITMQEMIADGSRYETFDARAYNQKTIEKFDQLIMKPIKE